MINVPLFDAAGQSTGSIVMDMAIYQATQGGNAVLDADGAIFFQRQLEYIKSRSYDVEYADLVFRMLFPISNEAGPGAQTITYRTYDRAGAAKIINSYAQDLPRADIAGKETTIPVRSVGISYGYNIDEIRAAQMTGMPLEQRRANAATRSVEETMNEIAFFGDSVNGLPGLFDNPNIPQGAVAGGAWSTKTPDEILADVNGLFEDIFETTLMKERGNTLLLPAAQWSFISSTARSATSDTTILNYLVQNSPYLNSVSDVIPVNEMSSTFNGLGSDAMMAYNRSPDKLQFEIPTELEMMPVQQKNLEFVVPGRARVGGLNVYYPLSAAIATGI